MQIFWSRILYAINKSLHSTTLQMPSVLWFGVLQKSSVIDELSLYKEGRPTISNQDIATIQSDASKLSSLNTKMR